MAFTPLSSLILRSAKKYKVEDSAKASLVIKTAKTLVGEIFSKVTSSPENLITRIFFDRDMLTICVANASVCQELHMRQDDLMADINKTLPFPWVKKIKIKIF
ncbi:MAG: DciA family protein [Candidatus Gracilibacteria bacterium]